MPHQDVTKTVQIDINYTMAGNNAMNSLHALATAEPGLADLELLAAEVAAWLTTSWAPLASEDWSCDSLTLTSLDSINGPRISVPISPPIQGTLADVAVPANVTLAVKADIGTRGRGRSGRLFWVGFANTQVTENQVHAIDAAAIVTAMDDLNTNVTALSGFDGLCVPHRQVAGVRPNPATSTLVQRFLLTNLFTDSQKDRLPFHKKKRRLPVS